MLSRNPRLLTPGPLALAPEVKASMQSDLGSRDLAFRQVTRDIRRAIQDLAGAGYSQLDVPFRQHAVHIHCQQTDRLQSRGDSRLKAPGFTPAMSMKRRCLS